MFRLQIAKLTKKTYRYFYCNKSWQQLPNLKRVTCIKRPQTFLTSFSLIPAQKQLSTSQLKFPKNLYNKVHQNYSK